MSMYEPSDRSLWDFAGEDGVICATLSCIGQIHAYALYEPFVDLPQHTI